MLLISPGIILTGVTTASATCGFNFPLTPLGLSSRGAGEKTAG